MTTVPSEPTTKAGREASMWPGLFAGETDERRDAWIARIEDEARGDVLDVLLARLACEDPEEPCDADGRDEHRWCDNCIARRAILAERKP
jgi:hypothetical protein